MKTFTLRVCLMLVATAAFAACKSEEAGAPQPAPAKTPQAAATPKAQPASKLEAKALDEIEVTIDWASSGKAQLHNGEFREPAAPGSASENVVMLTGMQARGDLDGDGAEDAAAILVASGGGSGSYRYLLIAINQNGVAAPLTPHGLGDRVKVQSLKIDERGIIKIELLTHGPGDAMPNPTVPDTLRYSLNHGRLLVVQ